MRKLSIILVIIFFIIDFTNAQPWKRKRWEAIGIIGVSNFLGELGGTDDIGGEGMAGFRDIEFKTTRHAIGIGMQYRMGEQFYSKINLIHGKVAGNDNLTNEPFRRWRNLHFRSPIVELSYNVMFTINKEQGGHRYKLKGVRGRKSLQMNTYFFVGIGGIWFNPKAKYEGKWVALRKLGTEGQGLPQITFPDIKEPISPSKKYSPVTLVIPIGLGFRRQINRQLNMAIEYGIRKTFTDYLDDVSTVYYDPFLMSDMAADLSIGANEFKDLSLDPNASIQSVTDPHFSYTTSPGQRRGDPDDKDVYMFFVLTFNYVMKDSRSFWPKF
ncbi:MAG: hypothetical protein JKY33_01010 [Bacteroidia bacterium]|nr:hypothetical protein [Bacteroidia bacterium]